MTRRWRQCLAPLAAACALLGAPAVAGLTAAGAAEPVYRCGNTYQQVPCSDGRQVDVADTRDAAQRRQAEQAARAERKSAAALAAENRTREKALRPQRQAAGVAPRPDPAASADAGAAQQHVKATRRKQGAQRATDKILYNASADRQAKKQEAPTDARMPTP